MLRRFGREDEGGVAIIVAAGSLLFVILAALAIDLGSIVLKAREVQGTADLAALAAARDIPRAGLAASATVRENLGTQATAVTSTGVYIADPRIPVDQRFQVGLPQPNGARVVVTSQARLYFMRMFGRNSVDIARRASAAIPGAKPAALFGIGSRLLSLDKGLVDGLLNGLLGSSINLSVMDYNTLVGADVNLLEFTDALAVKLGLEVGDYDALLAHEVEAGTVLEILEVLASSNERSVLSRLTGAGLTGKLKVSDLIGAGVDARDGLRRGLDVDVGALDLLMASLQTANNNRQLQVDSKLNLLVADVTALVAIGEKPNQSSWITLSAGGEPVISTAQTRVFLKVKTKDFLSDLASVDLQVFAQVAAAEAKVKSINCSNPRSVDVQARPGLLRLVVGRVENPQDLYDHKKTIRTSRLTIAEVLGIPVSVFANVTANDTTWKSLNFNQTEINNRTIKKVRSTQIGSSLLGNLLNDLDLQIGLLQLGWLGKILNPLGQLLGGLLDLILNPLLSALGIGLGEADVSVVGIHCPGGTGGIPNLVG